MATKSCQMKSSNVKRGRSVMTTTVGIPIPKVGFGYNYFEKSSKPVSQTRPKYRNNVNKPRGVHDYFNIMWDPHVYRGQTYKTFEEIEKERAKILSESKRRRKRGKHFCCMEIPKTPPPPTVENFVLNLDQFLVEKVEETQYVHAAEQTDYISRKKSTKAPVTSKTGFDISTEILAGDMFSFDKEVTPIVETVGEKVLDQALRESLEEEELMTLREEQNTFEERRRLETLRAKRLEERNQILWREKENLMKKMEEERQNEKELEQHVGARMFAHSYLASMTPEILETLGRDGLFDVVDASYVTKNIMPWLNREVETELCQQLLLDEVVDNMLANVCLSRKLEYATGNMTTTGDHETQGEGHE